MNCKPFPIHLHADFAALNAIKLGGIEWWCSLQVTHVVKTTKKNILTHLSLICYVLSIMYCMTGVIIETFLLKIFNYLWYIILLGLITFCCIRSQVADKHAQTLLIFYWMFNQKNIYRQGAYVVLFDFTIYPLEILFLYWGSWCQSGM